MRRSAEITRAGLEKLQSHVQSIVGTSRLLAKIAEDSLMSQRVVREDVSGMCQDLISLDIVILSIRENIVEIRFVSRAKNSTVSQTVDNLLLLNFSAATTLVNQERILTTAQ